MSISSFFQLLIPKTGKFNELFEKAAENLVKTTEVLKEIVSIEKETEMRNHLVAKIKEHEVIGDYITHTIFEELNKTFITPFDRDDIHNLTSSIDDVVDFINGACQSILLYKPDSLSQEFASIADLLKKSAIEIETAVKALRDLKNVERIKEACIKINTYENLADDVHHDALSKMFSNEKDAIELVKKKDIITTLEKAMDSAENVSDVIKTIIVKSA